MYETTFLDLVLGVLCAYRLTQLLVWDTLLEPVTRWLASRSRWLDELLACPHCTGFWCAVVTAVGLQARHWWPARLLLWAFALAGAVSILEHATCWLSPSSHIIDTGDNKE
jgi:hypothetical protein